MDYTFFKSPLYSLPSELTNSMVSFQVSIGSLDINILEGIKKKLLNSALCDLKNYTDLCIVFSVIQYLLLFLICQLKFLTNFQLPFNPSLGLLNFLWFEI